MIDTVTDVLEALAAFSRATRSLSAGTSLDRLLGELVEAAVRGTGAEIGAVWLPDSSGTLVARAVWASSGSLAAELEGRRSESVQNAAILLSGSFEGEVATLSLPIDADGEAGVFELVRRGSAFELDSMLVATLAADLVGLGAKVGVDGLASRREIMGVDVAGDALASVADDDGAAGRLARLAVVAAGAEAAIVWRLRGDALEAEGLHGPIEPSPELRRAARETIEGSANGDRDGAQLTGGAVTLQLGQPPLGALQLRFPSGRLPHERMRAQLAGFAVRAAHALRSSERARAMGFELERSRALLSVVGEAVARLSLSHTLDTAIERVAELLDADRVAIYLRDEGEMVVAASRGLEGPHEAIADALLAVALRSRQGGGIIEVDAAGSDERLETAWPQVHAAQVDSALALPLVVSDEPIGVLAVYPRRRRALSENESALLVGLAAQLAVLVENARLHERAQKLSAEREAALASELEKAKRLQALYEISRSFAQSLSLETTLKVLAESIVTLLGVDAAVIRMPDERGTELVARAVHVNDERIGAAARALLLRPQQLPRHELLALLERNEPLLLDADQAEAFGGATALLAPFLRKGSSAAIIPIATPAELLATLTIVSLHPSRPVAGETADTALSIAGQAALAIDNARLYGQQKAFADTMQRSLLPRAAPEVPGLELGDVYESAAQLEVGGDVYDYLTLEDGRLAVVLGDVTGHGVDAAADMAMAKYVFRSLGRDHVDPGEFLAAANDVVASEIAPGRFITMVELVIDAVQGEVACASGGHPAPRLVQPDGSVSGILARGLALGIEAPQSYKTITAALPPGAIVVVYTDGVIEARRAGEQYGVERLDALLSELRAQPPQQIADAALAACREWTEGDLTDDFALVVIKRSA